MFSVNRFACVLTLAAAAASGFAADKEPFQAQPAESYPARQTIDKVTIAAQVFQTDAETRPVFGKNNPNKSGVLPVLMVVKNGSGQAIRLEAMRVEYHTPGAKIEATPAEEVRFVQGPGKPKVDIGPRGPSIRRGKNPLDSWEIEGRAFSAKMLPPGESASGFFYFQTAHTRSGVLYVTGLREAGSGREIFFFEVPLAEAAGQ